MGMRTYILQHKYKIAGLGVSILLVCFGCWYLFHDKMIEKDVAIRFFYVRYSCDETRFWDYHCDRYEARKIISAKRDYARLLGQILPVKFANSEIENLVEHVYNTNRVYFVFEGDIMMTRKKEYVFYVKDGYIEEYD